MQKYKVMNPDGDIREVSEDKLNLAAQDDFLPVVSKGKDQRRVSFSNMEKAYADGYKALHEAPTTLESVVRGAAQGASFGFSDEITGALEAAFTDKTYEQARDESRQNYTNARETNPIAYGASEVGAGVATAFIPGLGALNAGRGAKIAEVVGKAALQGGLQGTGYSDKDTVAGVAADAAAGAALGGGLAYGVPKVISGVKGAANFASKMVPGTEDAFKGVNRATAKLGSMVPGTDIDAKELEYLLNNPQMRREARGLSKPENLRKIGEDTAGLLSAVDDLTDNQVGMRYAKAEHEFFSTITPDDIDNIDLSKIDKIKNIVQERPKLFGKAGKVVQGLDDILQRGGEREIGEATQDMSLKFMQKNLGEEAAAKMYAHRMLDARRHLDDVMKNVDYEKMLQGERRLIQSVRDTINDNLDNIPGAQDLRKMDGFFSDFTKTKKDALHKLAVPLPSGGREFTPESAIKFLKSDADQAKFIEAKMVDFSALMSELDGVRGAGTTKEINNVFNKIRKDFKILKSLDSLKRASGGPTSQAVNTAMQVLGAVHTMGASLLALPISNPAAWMNFVDGAEPGMREFSKKIQAQSLKAANLNPQAAARIMMISKMNQKDEDEEAAN